MARRAKKRIERTRTASPDLAATAHALFAEAHRLRGARRLDKAVTLCQALLRDHPGYAAAHHLLGLVHMDRGDPQAALNCMVRAQMLNPHDAAILASLAGVYAVLGADEMALRTLDQARAHAPDDPAVDFTLGQVRGRMNDTVAAADCFERVYAAAPDNAAAACELAECYADLGRVHEAARLFETVLADPHFAHRALYELCALPADCVQVDIMAEIDRARPADGGDGPGAASLLFARAALCHRSGDHAAAWALLKEANACVAKHQPVDLDELRALYARRLESARRFTPDTGTGTAAPAETISLFIAGASRSGKTTLEALLAADPRLKRGFECKIVQECARSLSQSSGRLALSRLAELPENLNARFAALYKRQLAQRAAEARVFINTNPHIVADVGRIAAAVPEARFVFMRRNRYDAAFRIFAKQYRPGTNLYACRLDTIAAYLDWYEEIVRVWCEKLPGRALLLDYETMVGDPQSALAAARRLCGLEGAAPAPAPVADDRGCAAPYRARLEAAMGAA